VHGEPVTSEVDEQQESEPRTIGQIPREVD